MARTMQVSKVRHGHAQASTSDIRSSKRKRSPVKYCEVDSDDSEIESVEDTFEYLDDNSVPLYKKAKVDPSKSLPKKIFPFEKLPAELKNQIYELCLKSDNPIFLTSMTKAYRRTLRREIMTTYNACGPRRRYRSRWGGIPPFFTTLGPAVSKPATSLSLLVPNLLILNKQIHAEAQVMLYANNDFAFEDTYALHTFLTKIGTKNVATLQDLTVNGWGASGAHKAMNPPAMSLLSAAQSLQRFHIDCRVHYDGALGVARQLFRDGHHWMDMRGEAAVSALDVAAMNFEDNNRAGSAYDSIPKDRSKDEDMEIVRRELRRLIKYKGDRP